MARGAFVWTLTAVLLLGLTVAGCGGDESELPKTPVVDDPPALPGYPPPEIVDRAPLPEQPGVPDAPQTETVDTPRVLLLGRGGNMVISADESIEQGLSADFTLELWIRPLGKTQHQILHINGLRLWMDNGVLKVETTGEPMVGPEVRSKEWHHVAIVAEGNKLSLYVNGKRGAQREIPLNWAPSGDITLGLSQNRIGPYVGEVDNFRLVGGALYTQNFLPSQTFVPADVHFAYDFDGSSRGSIVAAHTGNVAAKLNGNASLVPGSI